MSDILNQISKCIEIGKVDLVSTYPPSMKGSKGTDELTSQALNEGIDPGRILDEALIPAMELVGLKFSRNEIYVPQMLLSAKAMSAAMKHLKQYFLSGQTKRRGTFVIGTVAGDLHDIGKNLVAMMVEGAGWEVIDLGVDVKTEKFVETVDAYPGAAVGLSALLTTTMSNMEVTVKELRTRHPESKILIGGAPVTREYCSKIGADCYSHDPQGAIEWLKKNR